jgi:hypothetical protein
MKTEQGYWFLPVVGLFIIALSPNRPKLIWSIVITIYNIGFFWVVQTILGLN